MSGSLEGRALKVVRLLDPLTDKLRKGFLLFMKSYSFENWVNDTIKTPFLFFVQSMEEMLFPQDYVPVPGKKV